jgi:hypothetical protein
MALGIVPNTVLNKGCSEELQVISVEVVLFLHTWLIYNADFIKVFHSSTDTLNFKICIKT